MLIRVILENIFSFGVTTEFNMLSAPRYTDHPLHKRKFNDINILKFSAIYGANGAGKSNVIKSISLFRKFFNEKIELSEIRDKKNKFNKKDDRQLFGIEFICNEQRYLYAIEIQKDIVTKEEVFKIQKNGEQIGIFIRDTNTESLETTIESSLLDMNEEKDKLISEFFIDNMFKSNKASLVNFSKLKHDKLKELKDIVNWLNSDLIIIEPHSKIPNIPYILNTNNNLYDYFNKSMQSFGIGIDSIQLLKDKLNDAIEDKKQIKDIKSNVDKSPKGMVVLRNQDGERITIAKEKDGEYYAYGFFTVHNHAENKVGFSYGEESDGTKRLFDLLSAFNSIVNEEKVVLIDEVERSIHPVLIKKVIEKLTTQENIKGQFIFTTHESNLLDLSLLRRDEVWFIEKNHKGCSEIYPLSDYHEHKTKDIRKGYLQGRYGAIPFLGNLDDLKWNM